MLPRLHRPLAALIPALLIGLTACGSDSGPRPTDIDGPQGFDAVDISGEQGTAPKVTWKGQMEADDLEAQTLVEGTGPAVEAGGSVYANLWVGNGFSQEETYTSYGEDGDGEEELTVDATQLAPIFVEALEGHTVGSRVAVVGSADKAFGPQGQPSLGIGDGDTVLLIVDLMPEPEPIKPRGVSQSQMPKIVEKDGVVTGLDFTGLKAPAADGELLRSIVKKGTGTTLTKDMTITADYLGQLYDAEAPFDESYSKEPAEFPLTGVVQGWTDGLAGLKVGARVLLQIPPDLGYGEAGSGETIPPDSTLYFVIDIKSAKPTAAE